MKRSNVISWDDYFMGMAHLSAMRSKDPSTQVGACIVSPSKKVVGLGYNGFPTGINDDDFPWEKHDEYDQSKYAYVVHAELNAILNATTSLQGCSMYVSLFPCNECAKAIIQSGIKTLIYESDKYADTSAVLASKKMLNAAGVTCIQLDHQVSIHLNVQR
ncbi:MAG: dCMP deaminase family protein [Erysipelotrichaceae bacterium]|nr:dCMP deaminase family protein [Erysipelotrichaceae bacterium]MCD8574975.1 dCMP deaminase family protein [Erysipelotrichaceae bacterium]